MAIDFGTKESVTDCNFSPILHRFGDMAAKVRKSPILPNPLSFTTPALGKTPQNFGMKLVLVKTGGIGLLYGENFVILSSTVFD